MKTQHITRRLAPLWSLKHFVAVNPYFGLNELTFSQANDFLLRTSGSRLFMKDSFYLQAWRENKMDQTPAFSYEHLVQTLSEETKQNEEKKLNTVSDFYSQLSQKAWQQFAIDFISSWCAVYFDQGQTFLKYPRSSGIGLFESWLEDTLIDKSLELSGLKHVKSTFRSLSSNFENTIAFVLDKLPINESEKDAYLYRLLMQYQGWASYIRQRVWTDELAGKSNTELDEFLAMLLSMEYLFFQQITDPHKRSLWGNQFHQHASDAMPKQSLGLDLHESFERYHQNDLIQRLNTHSTAIPTRADIQAVFCIDVRSEVFRRHLESENDHIETIGFAGFFGAGFQFESLNGSHITTQCPVLLSPSHTLKETVGSDQKDKAAIEFIYISKFLKKAWLNFKLGAVSCFSFMGPIGVMYLPIMLKQLTVGGAKNTPKTHSFKWKGESLKFSRVQAGKLGISLSDQVAIVENAIIGMTLSSFSPIVLIVGHESVSQNNPYESALDCGACGGHSGRKNAQIIVELLNTPEVRKGLTQKNIHIPENTVFLSGVHNTTTDKITFLNADQLPATHHLLFKTLQANCKMAGTLSRSERALRFQISNGSDIDASVIKRSVDWSQVRPEWGLAGCHAFIAAPRYFTRNLNLQSRSFLHSYTWKEDADFKLLELILTAPVVVASWINLQYFASMVDNKVFGSGNKVLHNVVSGLGVLEGGYGDLKVGLPIQSLHDGKEWQHSPERLNVFVAAPHEAINSVLSKHSLVRNLFDNQWIHLFLLSDDGQVTHRYQGQGAWLNIDSQTNTTGDS